jgi:hypothetical protein
LPYDGGLPGRRNAAEQVPRGSKEKRVHLNPGIHRAHVAQRLEVGVQARRAGGGGPRGHAEYITPTTRRSSQAERTRILQGATRGSRGRSTQRSSGMMPFSARCGEYVLPAMKETCLVARICRRRHHGQIFQGSSNNIQPCRTNNSHPLARPGGGVTVCICAQLRGAWLGRPRAGNIGILQLAPCHDLVT